MHSITICKGWSLCSFLEKVKINQGSFPREFSIMQQTHKCNETICGLWKLTDPFGEQEVGAIVSSIQEGKLVLNLEGQIG